MVRPNSIDLVSPAGVELRGWVEYPLDFVSVISFIETHSVAPSKLFSVTRFLRRRAPSGRDHAQEFLAGKFVTDLDLLILEHDSIRSCLRWRRQGWGMAIIFSQPNQILLSSDSVRFRVSFP